MSTGSNHMKARSAAIRSAAAVGLVLSALSMATPASAQTPPGYGGTKVDCFINVLTAAGPLKVGKLNDVKAEGGNHGTSRGNCHVAVRIKKGNVVGKQSGDFNIFLQISQTFKASFDVTPSSPGQWKIRVCAVGRRAISTHFADDCKTITRTAVA